MFYRMCVLWCNTNWRRPFMMLFVVQAVQGTPVDKPVGQDEKTSYPSDNTPRWMALFMFFILHMYCGNYACMIFPCLRYLSGYSPGAIQFNAWFLACARTWELNLGHLCRRPAQSHELLLTLHYSIPSDPLPSDHVVSIFVLPPPDHNFIVLSVLTIHILVG